MGILIMPTASPPSREAEPVFEVVRRMWRDRAMPLDVVLQWVTTVFGLRQVEFEEARGSSPEPGRVAQSRRFPGLAQRFRWSAWRALEPAAMAAFVTSEVLPYMMSLGESDARTAHFFREVRVRREESPRVAPEDLAALIVAVDALYAGDEGLPSKVYGEVVDSLNGSVAEMAQHATPPRLRALMIALAGLRAGQRVVDPACGTGGLLVDAARAVGGEALTLRGCEISLRTARVAWMRLWLAGRADAVIDSRDALDPSEKGAFGENDRVLCDPPWGSGVEGIGSGRPQSDEEAFLALAVDSLAPGGRAVVTVPHPLLSRLRESSLRRKLLRARALVAVVTLPVGTLAPVTRVAPVLLVFERREDGAGTSRVWFASVRTRDAKTAELDTEPFLDAWRRYETSDFREPLGPEGLTRVDSDEAPWCWWVRREAIMDDDSVLDPSRYEPAPPLESGPEPAEVAAELLALEARIADELRALVEALKDES